MKFFNLYILGTKIQYIALKSLNHNQLKMVTLKDAPHSSFFIYIHNFLFYCCCNYQVEGQWIAWEYLRGHRSYGSELKLALLHVPWPCLALAVCGVCSVLCTLW